MGYAARKLIRYSEKKKLVDRESFVAQYVSLSIASMGAGVLLGGDDLLSAFACGTAFAWDGWFQKQTRDSNFSSIVDLLFNVATFIYIGAIMPWHDFVNADINLALWRLIVLSILVLLLKRIPVVVMMWKWIPDIKTFREAIFSGYFGPMGVGAIFMSTYGRLLMVQHVEEPPKTTNDVLALTIQPIVFFFVLSSVFVHGFAIPFFAFGRKAHVNLARTLSIIPTNPFGLEEPSWVAGIRRTMTNATSHGPTEAAPDSQQMSVVQAMHHGNRMAQQNTTSSQPGSLHDGVDPLEEHGASIRSGSTDGKASPVPSRTASLRQPALADSDHREEDWGGDNTVEMRKYLQAKHAFARRASVQSFGHDHKPTEEEEIDIADTALRNGESEDQSVYPRVREWLEGHSIVLEYQEHAMAETETAVIPVPHSEYKALQKVNNPFRAWLTRHGEKLASYVGWESPEPMSTTETVDLWDKGYAHTLAEMMKKYVNGEGDESCKAHSHDSEEKHELPRYHADGSAPRAAHALGAEHTGYPFSSEQNAEASGSNGPTATEASGSQAPVATEAVPAPAAPGTPTQGTQAPQLDAPQGRVSFAQCQAPVHSKEHTWGHGRPHTSAWPPIDAPDQPTSDDHNPYN